MKHGVPENKTFGNSGTKLPGTIRPADTTIRLALAASNTRRLSPLFPQVPPADCLLLRADLRHYEDRNLVEEIERQSNKDKSKDVGRSDDSSDYHDDDESMTAIALHERRREDAKLGKHEAQDRKLEDKPHGERQSSKCRDI